MGPPALPSTLEATAKRFLRILYADDVYELRELARLSFSREGHGIECLPDGEAALNRLTVERGFDLVITDHLMPRMNGLELVMHMRAMNHPARVVVVSSELAPEIDAAYRKLNVDGIIYKPVHPGMLRKLLNQLFPEIASAGKTVTFTGR